jgi:hypothetical protein
MKLGENESENENENKIKNGKTKHNNKITMCTTDLIYTHYCSTVVKLSTIIWSRK